jgi:hypothetical protein
MTHKLELLSDMLDGSNYDPVIWEDIKPLNEKLELLEMLVLDLGDIIARYLPDEAKKEVVDLISTYEKQV